MGEGGSVVMSDMHERARRLIALADNAELASGEREWLMAHMAECAACRGFGENVRETIHSLRAIPVAAGRSLVAATQARVRQRAMELRRQRERMWVVTVSCVAVSVAGLVTALATWWGFAWAAQEAQLPAAVWQTGFVVFCLMPALAVAIVLLARGTYLADHGGSYQG